MSNPTLGHIECQGCGGVCEVRQALRRGAHLYTHCDNCGTDQRAGSAIQNRLFYRSKWVDGPPPIPANAGEPPGDEEEQVELTEKPAPVLEPEPVEVTETKPEKRPKTSPFLWLFMLVGIGAAVLFGGRGKVLLTEVQDQGSNNHGWG